MLTMSADALSEEPILHYPAEGQRYAGAVDYHNERVGLRGWVLEMDAPGRPVTLTAVCRGVVISRPVHAMMDRPDIDKLLSRLTQCGFLLGWSRFDLSQLETLSASHPDAAVEIVIAETGQPVPMVFGELTVGMLRDDATRWWGGDQSLSFAEVTDYHRILDTGLFDEAWYLERYGEMLEIGMPPILDYLRGGESSGRKPNFYFDPAEYARRVGLPSPMGALIDYDLGGGEAGPPDGHLDERWYVATYSVPPGSTVLADYLAHRGERAPNPWFDLKQYRSSGGVSEGDPYRHFVEAGEPDGLSDPAERHTSASVQAMDEEFPSEGSEVVAEPELDGPTHDDPAEAGELGAPSATAPSAPPESGPVPAANDLGYAGTRAYLEAAGTRRAKILAEAEQLLATEGAGRADSALTLTVGRIMAKDRLGAARAAVIYFAETAHTSSPHAEETEEQILAETHILYQDGQRREAEEIYRLVFERGRRDYLVVLRLLESAVDRGDVANAANYAAIFEELYDVSSNPWATIAVARFHVLRGVRRDAVRLLTGVPLLHEDEPIAEAAILNNLINAGAIEVAATRSADGGMGSSRDLFAAHFRVAVARPDAALVGTMLADERAAFLPNWQLGEAMFRLSTPHKLPLAVQQELLGTLNEKLSERGLDDQPVVQARLHYLLQTKEWTELGALFEELEGRPLGSDRETLLRKLEFYCQSENTEGAEDIYSSHFASSDLNKWESITVLRLLGELKRWKEAGDTLIRHIEKGYDFGGGGHIAMRIVRKSRLHEAVLKAAESLPTSLEPELERFLGLVNEDLTILRRAVALSPKPPGADTPYRQRYRSSWVLGNGEIDHPGDEDNCIFLCTNQRYFLSALTFLCSFFGQAPQVNARIFVFLDKDVPRHWHGMFAMVAARFGRSIEVIHEAEFMDAATEHRVEYGFFSGGGSLSRAAYFRIYAAKYLLKHYNFRRAAYIDTDIICRGDLTGMLEIDLGDSLIAAAVEDYSIEVVNAAARNDLDPLRYFNSGVLLFKMDDPSIADGLDRAILISETEPERLVFHDQCALNIAFRDTFTQLPSRFNFYLRPSRERNGFIEDGVLLHFVDKPKPWDIVFDRTYREEWRVWALMLGTFMPQGLYIDVFSAANRD